MEVFGGRDMFLRIHADIQPGMEADDILET
jgi:hypothetical protein